MILTNVIWAGTYGGIAMAIWAMSMRMMGFTSMNMVAYEGCLITKKSSGSETFIAGILMHFILSIIIAFAYFYILKIFMVSGWMYGLLLGFVHWFIAGMMLPLMDKMNHCVQAGIIAPMKLYVSGYGISGILTFLVGHLIYGIFVGVFLII